MKSIFALTVGGAVLMAGTTATRAQLISEHFTYSDGEINSVSGGAWAVPVAGAALNVSGGGAVINQGSLTANGEAVSRAIATPFTVAGNSVAYYSFDATWTALPISTDGSYFVNLSVGTSATTPFYGRVGADLDGAAPGKFRVAVANANWTVANAVEFPLDLSLGVKYKVVVKYDLTTRDTTLWINPATESGSNVTATDAPVGTQQSIAAINLRQGRSGGNTGAPGIINLDNLLVGNTFGQVNPVPEPAEFGAAFAGGLVAFAFFRRRVDR